MNIPVQPWRRRRQHAGAKHRRQLEENAAAADMPSLSATEVERALPIADTIQTPGWI